MNFKNLKNKLSITLSMLFSKESKAMKRSIPNIITLYRIIIAFPIIFLLESGDHSTALILFITGGCSDWLDGFLARRYNSKSVLGAKLDPLADKILICGPLIWLTKEGILPAWAIWLTIARELLISGWRSNHKEGAPASIGGKLKTIFQFASIILLIFPTNVLNPQITSSLRLTGFILFWPGLLIAIISATNYLSHELKSHQWKNQG